jgi:hypothetical protein
MNNKCIGLRCSARDRGIPFATVNCRDREGVALILVIGMLALMVVLGITFSIYMRTERVAAGSFKSGVVARQLLPVALNRALDAINNDLGNKPYPSWNVLESGNGVGVAVSGVNNTNVMAWIPRAALGPNPNPSPRWIDPIAPGVEGRVGYLVVNCSGLLDANTSGNGVTPRGNGVSINEIQLSACQDVADAAALVAGRPYETIQEFGVKGLTSGALGQPVSNFVCFSYFPTGYVGGTNITLVDLSGDDNALTNRHADIVNGLIGSGIEASQAEFVYQNLLDYVDADDVPRDLGSACTESVPMFNEILVTNTYRFLANTNFDMRGRVYAEWFYPFVKTYPVNYWIEYSATFERAGATPATFPLPASVTGVVDSAYTPGLSFAASTPSFTIIIPSTNYAAYVGARIQLKAKINLRMHANNSSGPVVDASPSQTNLTIDLTLPVVTVPNPPSAISISAVTDAEVVDPRFNWDPSQWTVRANNNSLALTNNVTRTWLTARDTDGYAGMYVANRPLVSVAELTYLLRGQTTTPTDYRWNTIRLFDWVSPSGVSHPMDRVLDYFALGTNTAVKGFVNPNSGEVDVLTAAFTDMPVNNYPGETPVTTLTPAQARALAGFWADTNQNPARCNFTMLSDIGHATNVFNAATLSGWTPFQKESVLRNSVGLFNTRQQYFMILLYAQAAKYVPLMDDRSVLAEVRGIAEVWRDPLPNAEGIHPCVIRMVLPLNND